MFIKWFLVVLVPITRYLLGSTGAVSVGAFLMIVITVIGDMSNLKTIFLLCGSTLTIFGNPQMALIVSKSNVFVDTHSRFEFKTCVEYLWIPTFIVWLSNSMSKKKSNMTSRYFKVVLKLNSALLTDIKSLLIFHIFTLIGSNICSNVLLTLLVLEQVPPTGSLQHKFDFWTYVKFDFLTTILLSLVGTLIIYRLLRVIH
ncbi:unnamed protein product [Adineta steineri]|uniref:Uncharacterized protein n=1 Tax=Adineta steineri TaxID=433720 RepID=A0A813X8S6_9BILA|nr:unnamed protein product [Adineta steineri]CAF1432172.1 unnamed protein product [Adineta steineri]